MKTDPDGNMVWDKAISSLQGTKVRIKMEGGLAIASTKWVCTNKRENQDPASLVDLAKLWNKPPKMKLKRGCKR